MHRISLALLFAIVLVFSLKVLAAPVRAVANKATPVARTPAKKSVVLAQSDIEPIDDEEDDGVPTPETEGLSETDEEMQSSEPIEQTDQLPKKAETVTPAEPKAAVVPPPTDTATTKTPTGPIKQEPGSNVIFDWNKHQNETNVKHPFAEKGLTTITKNKEYIYKVNESPQKRAASLRVGQFTPINLSNPEATGAGSTFEDNYDETTNPMIMVDYEWQIWRTPIGKLGIRAGSGLYIAQGNGHFVNDFNAGKVPREIITFWATPHQLGAIYRMQLWDKQLIVPYGEGGGYAITFGEFRDDNKPPKWGGALAGYFAGGAALNLTYFDSLARIALDREYGINRVYFTVEYRAVIGFTRYDFTADLVNAGFLGEF